MTREELAARIYIANWVDACSPEKAFEYADEFLAYAITQRDPKALECEHDWDCSAAKPYWHCAVCGEQKYKDDTPKVKPEPPKPERVAREFILSMKYGYQTISGNYPNNVLLENEQIRVREILPGDEHGTNS